MINSIVLDIFNETTLPCVSCSNIVQSFVLFCCNIFAGKLQHVSALGLHALEPLMEVRDLEVHAVKLTLKHLFVIMILQIKQELYL